MRCTGGVVTLKHREEMLLNAEMRVCAFDIECTKMPLQFPNSASDQIFMISYMCDGTGYLIINREVVSQDISDFEYTPKPEYKGPFTVFNEKDEKALLRRFFDHMRLLRPCIYVTYNGDFFDWPFIADRAEKFGWSTESELGVTVDKASGEARGRGVIHMDAFAWVKRDSYLPQGSQGLKSVTRYKLGYDPVEVDPELMVRYAQERPQHMAAYSVSDAVCTYYLYQTYVHPFIFSLCKIIPMAPDEVLRKGSGTLCEALLMVEAFRGNIVAPNKQTSGGDRYHAGRLLESETYIGGHVECLESGVFRADIPCKFNLKPGALQKLIDEVDADLEYALRTEAKLERGDVANYEAIRDDIVAKLESLRNVPKREECPLIYHLDVAAMYPNIILTNRLQPPAIVTEDVCAACDFNVPGKECLRSMEWVWRGETYMASRSEVAQLRAQLEVESFPDASAPGGAPRHWRELGSDERAELMKARLKKYCQRVYKRVLDKPATVTKHAGVCQRENPFYVDTVRSFRDQRYKYKALQKQWTKKLASARESGGSPAAVVEAAGMVVLYDSLQLAHKCILNSFYGYVMRRGARWYSMEMAGVVTYTGANIIQRARQLVEQIGKPLELDTDGIWCCLPKSFPENFTFVKSVGGEQVVLSYPCIVLNRMVAVHNTNDQYARLVDPVTRRYEVKSEMSIAFEVDGPYLAMILPASKEKDKLIKKRYAVFNKEGHLAELKGFEMKRRGELKLIKVFQTEVFGAFLLGDSLETCYGAVASIANRWLDMLETQGVDLPDEQLLELISESTVMSKSAEEYGDRKSAAITTAARLSQFLNDERLKDKGLKCEYIVATKPAGASTSERCIPTLIFSCEPAVARAMLRKWTRDTVAGDPGTRPDPRDLIDWGYYTQRLGGAIQKIITIPAALQKVANPVPRVAHPDWLIRGVREKEGQKDIRDLFASAPPQSADAMGDDGGDNDENAVPGGAEPMDLEDVGGRAGGPRAPGAPRAVVRRMSRPLGEQGAPPEAEQPQAEAQPAPDKGEDYAAWLAHSKRKWSSVRGARKRARLEDARAAARGCAQAGGEGEEYDDGPGTGVGAFFRRADAAAVAASHWQLLQLAPAPGAPGMLAVWVMVGGAMYSVPVRVPRTLLVSLARPDLAADAGLAFPHRVRVAKHLPHGTPWNNLYAVTLDEADFARAGIMASACYAGLPAVSSDALAPGSGVDPVDVLGVFESQLPLQQQAILSLGCCATVGRTTKRRPLGQGYLLGELEMRTTAVCPYDAKGLRYVALYGAHAPGGERGLYVLLLPTSATSSRCVLVVTQRRGAREVTPPAAQRALTAALGRDVEAALAEAPELGEVAFEVVYAPTPADAALAVTRALGEHTSRARGPCVALAECDASDGELCKAVPLLGGQLPLVRVPHNAADAEDVSANPVGWQARLLRVALARIAASGPWLRERTRLAAYAHVPLGNLGPDWVITVADAFFARALRDANHVLWSSPSGEPDLGGGPADAAGGPPGALSPGDDLGDDVTQVASSNGGDDGACHACVPGAYRSACVELRLHNLAVCALVNAHLLPDIGVGDDTAPAAPAAADATTGPGVKATQLGGAHATAGAFRVLRGLVTAWVADAQRGNVYADTLLTQLYRWLSSPHSSLRDGALQRLVRLAMRRVFKALLSELQRLGAKVVYADFGMVWVATGKSTPEAAAAFVEGLRAAVQQKELFSWLGLVPTRTWHALLFRDLHNFGGVQAVVPSSGADEDDAQQQQDWAPVTHWTMAQYLPPSLQELFELTVSEFILLPWKSAREEAEAAAAAAAESAAAAETAAAAATGDEDAVSGAVQALAPATAAAAAAASALADEAASARAAGELLNSYFTHRLIRMTKDIGEALGNGRTGPDGVTPLPRGDPAAFPTMPGSHLTPEQLGAPALAFVRSVCEVFSLDTRAEAQVGLLRAQLLRLLRVREFSKEAEFVDPCASFTLRDVLCSYCHRLRDLDLCRDAQLADGDWRCDHPGCRHPYDLPALEARLVAAARGALRAYVLQDLTCVRPTCRRVKQAHLAARCPCGGAFAARMAPADAAQRLGILHRVATFHGFHLLEEVTAFALGIPFTDPVPLEELGGPEEAGSSDEEEEQEDEDGSDVEPGDAPARGAARTKGARRASLAVAEDSEDDDAQEEEAAVPVTRRPAPRRQAPAQPPRPGGRRRREARVLDSDEEDDDA